jgi:hypothetical protein
MLANMTSRAMMASVHSLRDCLQGFAATEPRQSLLGEIQTGVGTGHIGFEDTKVPEGNVHCVMYIIIGLCSCNIADSLIATGR